MKKRPAHAKTKEVHYRIDNSMKIKLLWGILLTLFLALFLFGCGSLLLGNNEINTVADNGNGEISETENQNTEGVINNNINMNENNVNDNFVSIDPVDNVISKLTLEEKVAQLFIVRPESIVENVETVVQAGDATNNAIHQYPVGGICYFSQNLVSADEAKTMFSNVESFSEDAIGLPMFIAVDEEGGTVVRVADNEGFTVDNVGNMRDIANTGDINNAYNAASYIGGYLRDLGINVDFAPVADMTGNVDDVMYLRSFGDDPSFVSQMIEAQVRGFKDSGILCAVKHFPGIGDAIGGDSHENAIYSDKDLEQLEESNFIPFKAAIDAGCSFVMVGHLALPKVTGNDIPASLNPDIIGLLRNNLGFQGVIITDSLEMGGAQQYSQYEIGVKALEAGNDMLLMPSDFFQAYQGVLDAVNNGEISEQRINQSLKRILEAKMSLPNGRDLIINSLYS